MNIANMLVQGARCFPQKKALIYGKTSSTYEELNAIVDHVALYLRDLGVTRDQRVSLYLPNIPAWPMFYYAIARLGAISVCIAAAYKRDEMTRLVNDSLSSVVITCEELLPHLPDRKVIPHVRDVVVIERDPKLRSILEGDRPNVQVPLRAECGGDDVATFLYTGGTTGVPKGAMLTHRNLIYSAQMVCYHERTVPEDVGICFMPLNHVFGLCHIMNSMFLRLCHPCPVQGIRHGCRHGVGCGEQDHPFLRRADHLYPFPEQSREQELSEDPPLCVLRSHEHACRNRAAMAPGIPSRRSTSPMA